MKKFTIRYRYLAIFLLVTKLSISHLFGQAPCSTIINTTNVTCPSGKDGTVEIITYGPDGQVQNGLCRAPIASPYTCETIGCTKSITTNTSFDVAHGEVACVQVANFNQNITFNGGGHVVFCGTAAPLNINFNGDILSCKITILSGANVTFSGFNNVGNSELKNYGTITFNGTGYNGVLENNGVININNNANINATKGDFTNNGTIAVQGSFNIYNRLDNYGTITVTQDVNVNSGSAFRNYCTLSVTGNLMISPSNNPADPNAVDNFGKIAIGNQTTVNGTAVINLYNKSQWQTKNLMLNGPIEGPVSPACALMTIASTGQITFNSGGQITGGVSLCYPTNVTKTGPVPTSNCSCTVSDPPTLTWLTTPNAEVVMNKNKITGLAANTYNIQVKIPGCNGNTPYSKSFTINQPAAIVITESFEGNLATVVATGGNGSFSYKWSDQVSGDKHVILPGQTFTVTATDAKGCTKTKSITNGSTPCPFDFTLTGTDLVCSSVPSGKIDVTVTGVTDYYITLNNQTVTNPITNLVPGDYTVYVTSGGCRRPKNITIGIASNALKLDVLPVGNQLLVLPTGGVTPYTILWSDGSTSDLKTPLPGMAYIVTVTDAAGCKVTKEIIPPENPCMNIFVVKQEATCGNTTLSSARILILTTGSGNYSYQWLNASNAVIGTGDQITGLVSGSYTAIVKDNVTNCQAAQPFVMNYLNSPLVVDHTLSEQIAKINVVGGTPPYQYTWRHGAVGQQITLGGLGRYIVDVKDQNGCPGSDTIDYTKECHVTAKVNIDYDNGAVTVVGEGGTLPYKYTWSHSVAEDRYFIPNLPAGNYTVTVTDASPEKCSDSRSFSLPKCNKTITVGVTASCQGSDQCNGSAVVHVIPKAGVSFLWSNGYTDTATTNLCSGVQWVDITVPNCGIIHKKVDVPIKPIASCDPSSVCGFDLSLGAVKHFSCFEAHDAYINVNVTGSYSGNLSYQWEYPDHSLHTSPSEDLLSVPAPGTYKLIARIANGAICERTLTVVINGPSASLSTDYSYSPLTCYGGGNGQIQVFYSGGTGTPTITWADGSAAGFIRSSLSAGTYYYTLKDANGCYRYGAASVPELFKDELKIHPGSEFICTDLANQKVSLTVQTISGFNTYVWSKAGDPSFSATGTSIEVIQPGSYVVKTSKSGCSDLTGNKYIASKNCNTPPPDCSPIEIIDTNTVQNPCSQRLQVLYSNAKGNYNSYIEYEKTQFKEKYISKCLASLNESLTMQYENKEYHYTLYYYDQVGNLVRTVPPAGVVPLTDAEVATVKSDKIAKIKTVFPKHTLESTYQFNTLNSQINADIPDHVRQSLWKIDPSQTNLPSNANVEASYVVDDSKGFLISNENNIGYIYTSSNGGSSWDKLAGIGLPNLNDVQWIDDTRAIAVGSEGVFLETTDAGVTWKYRFLSGAKDFRKITLDPATLNASTAQGFIFDNAGNFYAISNNSGVWTVGTTVNGSLATKFGGLLLQDVHQASATKLYAVSSGSLGRIFYTTTDVSVWTEVPATGFTMPATAAIAANSGQVAATASVYGGNFLQISSNYGSEWKFLSTDATLSAAATKIVFEGSTAVTALVNGTLYRAKSGENYNLSSTAAAPFGATAIADIHYKDGKLIAISADGKISVSTTIGGNFTALAAYPNTLGSTVGVDFYSSTAGAVFGNGLYVTVNGGSTWSADLRANTTIGSTSNKITATIAYAHFSNASQGLVLAGNTLYYRNTNNTWTQIASPASGVVQKIAFDPVDATKGCLITSSGTIFTTINAGSSWTQLSLTIPTGTIPVAQLNKLAYADGRIHLSLLSGGVLSGTTTAWNNTTGRIALGGFNGINVNTSNLGYVVGGNGAVLKTTNGTSWQFVPNRINSAINDVAQNTTHLFMADAAGVVHRSTPTGIATAIGLAQVSNSSELSVNGQQLAVNASTGALATGVNASSDTQLLPLGAVEGGATAFRAVSVSPAGNILEVGDNGRIYAALTNNSSSQVQRGVNKLDLLNDASYDAGNSNGYIIGNKGTLLKTTDGGASWRTQTINTNLNPIPDLLAVTSLGTYAVAVGKSGFIVETSNGASPWQVSTSGVTTNLNDVALLNTSVTTVGDASTILFKNGASWTKQNIATSILPANTVLNAVVYADNNWIFVGGANGLLLRYAPVNGTPTWKKLEKSVGVNWTSATIKALYFKDRLTGYAFCDNGSVLKTVDSGEHWEQSTEKSLGTTANINSVSVKPDGGLVVAGNGGTNLQLQDKSDLFSTRFWYDEMGRIVVSQNSKQLQTKSYSYNVYDELNRVVEVGEVKMPESALITSLQYAGQNHWLYYNSFKNYWLVLGERSQVTKTYYNQSLIARSDFPQENLRKRIASITYEDLNDFNDQTYNHATHYSYDMHGNVTRLLQENPRLKGTSNTDLRDRQFIVFEYSYDLISGKVNQLAYQPGKTDAFYHRYQYDADNRIISVETSADGFQWKKDAKYFYYAHGPLAKGILGSDTVQTMDYAYTLQGWVKGMNAGQFSYAIGYHNSDYASIGANSNLATPTTRPLYNGNVATMSTKSLVPAWSNFNNPIVQQFEYDQLHRLTASTTGVGKNYKTAYSYDANGNILTLGRYNDQGNAFDTLTFRYENTFNTNSGVLYNRNTNKLRWVDDGASAATLDYDIEDQSTENYSYDNIGNLLQDKQEGIDKIEWTVYGKISKITRTPGTSDKPDLEFKYDAMGHRVEKIVKGKASKVLVDPSQWTYTYYVRDAQGNVISTYSKVGDMAFNTPLLLSEHHIYGSKRVGMYDLDKNLVLNPEVEEQKIGVKGYELVDQLANVRLVLSDRKTTLNQSEILSANDYYAFGMMMPQRKFNSNTYRYGYGGNEMDNEVQKGDGNSIDFGNRIYDSRLSKFFSIDQLCFKYPEMTPYQYSFNNPLKFSDHDGDSVRVVGTSKELSSFVSIVQKELGSKIKVSLSKSGALQLQGNPNDLKDGNKRYYDFLNQAVSHKKDTKIHLADRDEKVDGTKKTARMSIAVGQYPAGDLDKEKKASGNGTTGGRYYPQVPGIQNVDMADIENFDKEKYLRPGIVLFHEIYEAYLHQVGKETFHDNAHNKATQAQTKILDIADVQVITGNKFNKETGSGETYMYYTVGKKQYKATITYTGGNVTGVSTKFYMNIK